MDDQINIRVHNGLQYFIKQKKGEYAKARLVKKKKLVSKLNTNNCLCSYCNTNFGPLTPVTPTGLSLKRLQ